MKENANPDDASGRFYRHRVGAGEAGLRLDKAASAVFDDFSRASLQKYIAEGLLQLNGQAAKAKQIVQTDDVLSLVAPERDRGVDLPEDIALDIVYEDDALMVVDKPAGLVVHPGAGNRAGTLVNALLHHDAALGALPRAGLVHRIDKDTTGLLMIAKTAKAQLCLIDQLKSKSVYRHYLGIVAAAPSDLAAHRAIDAPLGRHRQTRTKMAVRSDGKAAITDILGIKAIGARFCLLDIALRTGRTHQIRVHLAHIGHGLVGDPVYNPKPIARLDADKQAAIDAFGRQALHAHRLGFLHPTSGERMQLSAPMPPDMRRLLAVLGEGEKAKENLC